MKKSWNKENNKINEKWNNILCKSEVLTFVCEIKIQKENNS
jgi:hypothetical protein